MHGNRKYTLDQNYFKKIDSQEKAYFLGFMYADGSVSKKFDKSRISLQKQDRKILEEFKILLKTNKPLYKIHELWVLMITSKKIKQDLIDKGCMPNKTFKLVFPLWLKEDLKSHFIRGYFDGDGCVNIQNIKKHKRLKAILKGRKNFLEMILNISKITGHIHKQRKTYSLVFCSSFAKQFLNLLYKDATIFLERKHQKFLDYLDYEENKKVKPFQFEPILNYSASLIPA